MTLQSYIQKCTSWWNCVERYSVERLAARAQVKAT